MTNDIPSSPSNRSLAIRWIAATSIVAAVGFGGFFLRGEDSQRRESSPPATSPTTTSPSHADRSFSGLGIPDLPSVDVGMGLASDTEESAAAPTLTDFAPCDAAPQPVPTSHGRGWTHHATAGDYPYAVEFDHPSAWDVSVDGDQIAAVSPSGERAFVIEVVPFDRSDVPMADLFSTMQNMHPERDYSSPRPVVVNGKPGCVATASGDGHSGEIGLLRGDGFMVIVTAGHELDPPASAVSQAWTLIGSVQVSA